MRYVARPRSLFTFRFDVTSEAGEVGSLRHRAFRSDGELSVRGVEHRITLASFGTWVVERTGIPGEVARVERTGMMGRTYRLSWNGSSLHMLRVLLGYRTNLVSEGELVGEIHHRSLMSRSLVGDIPDHVPAVAVLTAMWMIVRLRRRAAAGGRRA